LIVVDTNVMVDRLVGGKNGADAALLFESDPEWAAPTLLVSELRNVLLGYVRRGDLRADQAKAMYEDAAEILGGRITRVGGSQVIDIALECDLTAYDAEFVALARELGVALATSDKAILKGATDVAVSVRNARDLAERR
jgi:predicted nucleic acid-binding protein